MSQWDCKYCSNLFPKDEEGQWEKIRDFDFSINTVRRSLIKNRNSEKLIKHKKWKNHLINIPSNPVLNGRCPQSVCSFCLFYDGQLFEFNNRSSYNYHRKKCPHKKKDLKRFIKNYDYECKLVDEQEDIIFFKEQEEDKKMMELKKEKEALEEKKRKEEDFKSRASFYDPPPPRSQASIDREKNYKKTKEEIAIDEVMT
tara:strand:+ start:237 stop:833 length:597 start_codon:yes stop_codon:yes gene_type:complete